MNLAEVERELASHRLKIAASDADWNEFASPGLEVKLKQLVKKHGKLEDKVRELEVIDRKVDKSTHGIKKTQGMDQAHHRPRVPRHKIGDRL